MSNIVVPMEGSIAGWVVSHGEPRVIEDVTQEPSFFRNSGRHLAISHVQRARRAAANAQESDRRAGGGQQAQRHALQRRRHQSLDDAGRSSGYRHRERAPVPAKRLHGGDGSRTAHAPRLAAYQRRAAATARAERRSARNSVDHAEGNRAADQHDQRLSRSRAARIGANAHRSRSVCDRETDRRMYQRGATAGSRIAA